jgi:predicted nucleic acid-binding protein
MAGITLDTGALIGFERSARRTMTQLKLAEQFGYELTVPSPVIVEAWRAGKRSARVAALLEACVIEPLFPDLARIAGEAIAAVKATFPFPRRPPASGLAPRLARSVLLRARQRANHFGFSHCGAP